MNLNEFKQNSTVVMIDTAIDSVPKSYGKQIRPYTRNKSPYYDRINNRIIRELRYDKDELKQILHNIETQLTMLNEVSTFNEGSGGDLDKFQEKVGNIERDLAVLIERTKKLDEIPTREEIKNIITDALDTKSKDMASKSDVKLEVSNARTTQILWTVGSVITIVGIATTIILKFA